MPSARRSFEFEVRHYKVTRGARATMCDVGIIIMCHSILGGARIDVDHSITISSEIG